MHPPCPCPPASTRGAHAHMNAQKDMDPLLGKTHGANTHHTDKPALPVLSIPHVGATNLCSCSPFTAQCTLNRLPIPASPPSLYKSFCLTLFLHSPTSEQVQD